MLKLSDFAGRILREGEPEDLGVPAHRLIEAAIDEGRGEDAKRLARSAIDETKTLHDLMCDWVWDLLTQIGRRHGEDEMHEMLRASQAGWMMRRTWSGFLKLSVEKRVALTAEIMRSHRCGPEQDGEIEVIDEGERYAIIMDPCGSGGRMRRGDPENGTPSRLGPPYDFAATSESHDWSWGQTNVPYYCLHCCLNEKLAAEWGGHPLWVTGYDPDAHKPCAWYFYKSVEDIPAEYYERIGLTKPATGQGRY